MKPKGRRAALLCGGALLMLTASPSFAQNTANSAVQGQPADGGGEQSSETTEIVVTAQGRAQALQDVPIAINVVEGETFQERALINLEALVPQLPSVTLAESPFQKTVAIRGLGSTGGNIGYEQSAPLFVDGIFGGRGGQFNLPFFDLARVEVVRGPQAIFFGKNATAGAISIVSARPTTTFEGSLYAGYEAQNEGWVGDLILSGPFSDTLRGRLSLHTARRGDYLFDTSTGESAGRSDEYGVRAGLAWDASSAVSFYLKGEYTKRDADRRFQLVCANRSITQVTVSGVTAECVEDQRLSSGALAGPLAANFPPGSDFDETDAYNAVLKTDIDVGDHQLELTSGFSAFESRNQDGLDRSSIGLAVSTTQDKFEQYSQEARLLSPTGGPIEYVLGALYIHSRQEVNQTLAQLAPSPVGDYIAVIQKNDSYSAFGRLTWNIAPNFRVSAGGRFTHEKKDYDSLVSRVTDLPQISSLSFDQFPANPIARFPQNLSRSESSFDPSVTIEWNASKDLLIFASVARGTKAGGFEFFPRALVMPLDPASLEYEEERALNFEAGFKASFANGLGQLNGAVFYNDLKDLQNQLLDIRVLGFQTFNAQEAHSSGFELEGFVKPIEQIKIGGTISYLDAVYDRFVFPVRNVNFTGNRLPFAPEWSGNAYIDGSFDLSAGLRLSTHLQVNHTGAMSFDASNAPADNGDAYTTFDARLALELVEQDLELAVNARNLFNKDDIRIFSNASILATVLPQANPRGVLLAEGRTVFLTLRKRF